MFLKQLWEDDCGAIISVEWLMLVSLGIFGVVPGVVALRTAINNGYQDIVKNLEDTLKHELENSMSQVNKNNNSNVNTNVNTQTVNVYLDYTP